MVKQRDDTSANIKTQSGSVHPDLTFKDKNSKALDPNMLDSLETLIKPEDIRNVFSAQTVFTPGAKIVLLLIIVVTFISFILDDKASVYVTVMLINILFFTANSYRLGLFFSGLKILEHSRQIDEEIDLSDQQLPKYTVLIPLYHEAAVVPYLTKAMLRVDYPKNKLQVMILVEDDDTETIAAVKANKLPDYFQVEVVPNAKVKTKANALNWGLSRATGELVTIFDAEDRPNPDQLKKVAQKFVRSPDNVACIQARLNFYNAQENVLTKLFSLEYENLFNYILPAMAIRDCPIPLGGTSNHFKTKKLRELGGWDSYNVTEDADLGMRLAAAGYKSRMVYSFTPEEATMSLRAWMKQRTRWLKGYMHTYFVYMRKPGYLIRKYGFSGFMFFNYSLFLSPFLLVIMPIMIYFSVMIIIRFYAYEPWSESILKYFTWFNLIYGYLALSFTSYTIYAVEGLKSGKLWWLYPFYFILHIFAALMAVYKLLVEPHKWDKTTHGVSKFKE